MAMPLRILIAEDDLSSRTMLTGVLIKEDYEVTATDDCAAVWDALQKPDAPRLVILDWMMPKMNGLDVVRRIRAVETDRPPYVIMLTIKSEKADIIAGLEAGANDYLAKPFDPGELRARVAVGRRMVEMQDALADKIEDLRDSEKRYRELCIVDDLTQTYNSRHFYFQLKSEINRSNRYGKPLTMLLLDIDNFKAFNDTYGHVEGDTVLSRLGQVVKRSLRKTDSAYRYGGEEFTILLPMTSCADGVVTAERMLAEFKKETFTPAPGQEVHLTVSIGLAQYRPEEEMKAFVHRVDQLMYQGKKDGKDRLCSELSAQE